MLIALDYDKTYSAAPAFWDAAIALGTAHGVTWCCITLRFPEEMAPVQEALGEQMPCYATSREANDLFSQRLDVHPDIWVDDDPSRIFVGKNSPAALG